MIPSTQIEPECISDFESSQSLSSGSPQTPLVTAMSSLTSPVLQSTPAELGSCDPDDQVPRTKTSDWLRGVSLDEASHVTETDMSDMTVMKTPLDSAKKVSLIFTYSFNNLVEFVLSMIGTL